MKYFHRELNSIILSNLIFIILLISNLPLILHAVESPDEGDYIQHRSRNYQQAISYIKKSDYNSAESLLKKELETNPKDADTYNYMGYALRKMNDLKHSAIYYARALEIDPEHLGALEYQGELFLILGNLERATANLQQLEKLCWMGCDAYNALRASIEDYRKEQRLVDNKGNNPQIS
jgi:tetratricopeptide (TPR) repeat protein